MKRFWLIALAVSACGSQDSISSLLSDYETAQLQQNDVLCDCWDEWDYSSRAECTGDLGILPATRRCIEDALAGDEDSATVWLECVNQLEFELALCYDQLLDCFDTSSTDPCLDDYNLGLGECIGLPQSVQRDLDECLGQ